MQFEYDPERLIEEIKKRPGIWDFDDAEYRTKTLRSQLWKEVVKELMQSDVKITKSEMRELELQLQKKWKSIRDSYHKYKQNPSRTRRPYIYSKHLQFLVKNTMPPQNDAGASSESDDTAKQSKKNMWKHKKVFKLSKNDQSSDDDNDTANDNDNVNSDNEEESRDYSNFDEPIYTEVPVKVRKVMKPEEFVFANVDAPPKNEVEDPDKLFLLSLLPHLKAVPEAARLNAKMDLMQVLRNASFARDQKIF